MGRTTGIVLGHAARQAWEKAGRKVRVLHDRILGIPLQSCGGLSWIYSIHAPTGVTAAQYNEFLNIIETNINTNHDDLSEAFYIIGDWNAHIGRDSKPDKVIIGPHTMRQSTSARGKTLEKWLRSQLLTKTDTHFYIPRRGTWQHNTTKQWYELDGMVTQIGTQSRVQRIRTRPTAALSDHHAKEFYVHFTTLASTTRRHQRRQRFQAHDHRKQHQNRIRYDLLQGPTSGDIKKQYRDRLDELLCEEGVLLSRPPKPIDSNPVYIFTDGSCGKTNDSIAGWGVVAYETIHIDASLKNNIDKHTVPADYTMCGPVQLQQDAEDFLGACRHSNNTAEISAIGHALVLARTRYQRRPVTICYDSEYAASIARGEWMAHTNEKMAQRIQKLVAHIVKEQDIEWKWVKGHDNIVGNERADGLAKCGTEGKYHNAHDDGAWTAFTVAANHTAENSQIENITTTKFITLCRQSADEILGRGPPPFSGSPFTAEDRNTAADYKRRLKETWSNIHREQGTGREIPIRTEYHRLNREFRKFKYKAKHAYIRQVCMELEGAMEAHDVGKFYKLLSKLGIQLEGFSRRGLEPHSLQQITTYLTELGSNPHMVTDATIEQGLPQLPYDYTLDTAPHDAEILHELNRMKHSAPGEDEVTSSMYKSLSPLGKRVLCQRLRDLWTSPTHTWSSSLHSTLGFRLHKKGCRHDIGNYRTLWLISVIVRLLCRILAARVSRYCEFHHLLPDTQWGFRANHSTQGPAMLLRCIAEQANAIGTRPVNAPARVAALFLDIEKAYPSVPTDAAEKLFLRVGLPPVFVKLLVGSTKTRSTE